MQDWIRKALGQEDQPRTRAQVLEDGHRARMQFREDENNRRSWISRAIHPEPRHRSREETLADGDRARENFREGERNRRNFMQTAFAGSRRDRGPAADGLDNRTRYSDNHLPPHPPVTVGGHTFHFKNDKASWDRGGWGGPNQSKPGKIGTYSSTGDLGVDEQRLIVRPNGTGIFVTGGNGHEYARGTAVLNRAQVRDLRAAGVHEVPERGSSPRPGM